LPVELSGGRFSRLRRGMVVAGVEDYGGACDKLGFDG